MEEVYKIIDDFLINLNNSPNGNSVNFDRYSTDGVTAFNIMIDEKLILGMGLGMNYIHHITELGKAVIKSGGYEIYNENKKAYAETVNRLEFQKLTMDVAKLKLDIPNSEQLNRRDTVNKWIAIAALTVSIITLIYTLSK